METVITVTELARAPGNYEISVKRPGQSRLGHYNHLSGVESAAAQALDLANNIKGSYVIYAPKKVEEAIRSGGIRGHNE